MTEKGCDNCYYSYFDEKAYPCSLCTRGIERTDMWQPMMRWIPVTERLPNKQDDYFVTIPLDNNSTFVDVLHFHKGKFYDTDSEWGDVEYDDVTAWMPLPEPYGEREGE